MKHSAQDGQGEPVGKVMPSKQGKEGQDGHRRDSAGAPGLRRSRTVSKMKRAFLEQNAVDKSSSIFTPLPQLGVTQEMQGVNPFSSSLRAGRPKASAHCSHLAVPPSLEA